MKKMKLLPLIQSFFQKHLLEERGLSSNTVRSYRDATKDFLRYLCRIKRISPLRIEPEMLTADALLRYLSSLDQTRGLSIRTRNQRLAAIKTLLSYLGANDLSHIAVYQKASMIAVKRRPHRTMDYLVDAEMKALLAAAEEAHHRHRLLLNLLYNTGARVQEICDLKFGDVVFGPPPSVYLMGKGSKRRQVPLWPKTAEMLLVELEKRGFGTGSDNHVIVNAKGKSMTRFGALHIVKTLAKRASRHCPSILKKRISPHVLRHTTAMHLLQSGVDLSVIKMWLGHVNINTTHGYVELDIEMKREVLSRAKKLKPRAELRKVLKENKDVIAWLETL
jgi:integrase/recombinase XerD